MRRVLLGATLWAGCVLTPGGGGGTGGGGQGGGGAEQNAFKTGFAFVRRDDKQVYVADQSDFSAVYAVTQGVNARTPSLSKDGKRIVFVSSSGSDSELDIVPAQGGAMSTVLTASSTLTARNLRTPVFTPDGERVVFSYDDGATGSVGIVDVTGANFTKISPTSGLAFSGASVYPDGSAVLAAAGGTLGMLDQLQRIDLMTGTSTVVAISLGNDAVNLENRVVVSPDGTKAAFDARISSGSVRVFAIDLASGLTNQLTDYPSEPGANDAQPCWMGQNVCFSSDTGGNDAAYALPSDSMRTSGGLQLPAAVDPWFGPN